MSKYRNFTFTHNNYPDTTLEDGLDCKYIVYGKEVGESGTPHLQGMVVFKHPRSLSAAIRLLPGCHVEIARDAVAACQYCKKDGSFVERGMAPLGAAEAAHKGVEERWALAKAGLFEQLPPEHIKVYEYIKRKFSVVDDMSEIANEWRYGPTGCGKSRGARTDYPDLYSKDVSKWWDGYDGEETVLIEDWDPKTTDYLSRYLKIWADHYSFKAEVKGGSMNIRPKRVIVTSQYCIDECFLNIEDGLAIKRRFKEIRMYY